MNVFKLVRRVLDETYEKIEGSDEEKRTKITAALKELSARFRSLKCGSGSVDYADPVVRFAYVYAYVTSPRTTTSA